MIPSEFLPNYTRVSLQGSFVLKTPTPLVIFRIPDYAIHHLTGGKQQHLYFQR